MAFDPGTDYYIIPWGSTLTKRPTQPLGRCVQTTPEWGVLVGLSPQQDNSQKWTIQDEAGLSVIRSAVDPRWVLTHHSITIHDNHGINDGPISMSLLRETRSRWQTWKIVEARKWYNDKRFPENVFLLLTNSVILVDGNEMKSCLGCARKVFTRPQHILEWRVKSAGDEMNDKNQTFIVRS